MSLTLFPLLLAAATATSPGAPSLVLAGGSLRTCSDLAPAACIAPPARASARRPPTYVVDDGGVARALDPLLWEGHEGAPSRDALLRMLASARPLGEAGAAALEDRFDAYCAAPCRGDRDRPWRALLDGERSALLSALEVPQGDAQARAREQAYPGQERDGAGLEVLRAFVAAAAQRAPGARPRIAVVTASASDPMDPVDFYLDLFAKLGAQAEWWPVDAALGAAVDAGECRGLDAARRRLLGQSGRDRIYADLGALQWRACLAPAMLETLPGRVQGVFFAGGDQWRHRTAFFRADGQAQPWLRALREAHARGALVVGGTSAGTAVQSGVAMVSNGSPAAALSGGAHAMPPLEPGCGRAGRCARGLPEDTLTFWPAGGLGLLPGWTLDTHFSERARELRLLRLMDEAGAALGAGVDETSALQFTPEGDGWRIEAIGAHGGWVFERLPRDGRALRARVHYLAPGASLQVRGESVAGTSARAARIADDDGKAGPTPDDALADGALREAAQRLAAGETEVRLRAGDGTARLSRTDATRAWRTPGGRAGATHLLLRWEPGTTP